MIMRVIGKDIECLSNDTSLRREYNCLQMRSQNAITKSVSITKVVCFAWQITYQISVLIASNFTLNRYQ